MNVLCGGNIVCTHVAHMPCTIYVQQYMSIGAGPVCLVGPVKTVPLFGSFGIVHAHIKCS